MISINCNGRLFSSATPVVMGILNATPDSFYTQGRHSAPQELVDQAGSMLEAGAALLDIGGLSTRPGAASITAAEEAVRVLPVIEQVRKAFPHSFISVDTYRASVARQAVQAGADMVNDISAGTLDEQMLPEVAAAGVPYIAMHMSGTPQTMQREPFYENVTLEVMEYFIEKLARCREAGIKDIILDPGFGFGKTIAHNYQMLKEMHTFSVLGCPVLAGISRKSMIYKLLGAGAEEALNGTTALHMLALQQQAAILRVHDVKEAAECVRLFSYYQTI